MRLRPTATQAIWRGAFPGALIGIMVAALLSLLVALGALAPPLWLAIAAPTALGFLVGGAAGLALGRHDCAELDEVGIHLTLRDGGSRLAPWQRIAELGTQRRGGRACVTIYLDDGQVVWLPVPYDGRWLAVDPGFERKVFMLRHLWEIHRTFDLGTGAPSTVDRQPLSIFSVPGSPDDPGPRGRVTAWLSRRRPRSRWRGARYG